MADNNEIRIPLRSSDREVIQQLEQLEQKLKTMEGKFRDLAQTSRRASKETSEGVQETSGAFQGLENQLENIGKKMLAVFSVEAIRRFVTGIIEEQRRLQEAAGERSLDFQSMLFSTGFTANAGELRQFFGAAADGGVRSALAPGERHSVFGQIAGAAPGLSAQDVMGIARPILESQAMGADAGIAGQVGAIAGRIMQTGDVTTAESVNIAAAIASSQGGLDAGRQTQQMAAMMRDLDPAMGGQESLARSFGLVTAGQAVGTEPTMVVSGLQAFQRARTSAEASMQAQLEAEGHSSEQARAMARDFGAAQFSPDEFQRRLFEGTPEERAVLGRAATLPFQASQFDRGYRAVISPGPIGDIPVDARAARAAEVREDVVGTQITREDMPNVIGGASEEFGFGRRAAERAGFPRGTRTLGGLLMPPSEGALRDMRSMMEQRQADADRSIAEMRRAAGLGPLSIEIRNTNPDDYPEQSTLD